MGSWDKMTLDEIAYEAGIIGERWAKLKQVDDRFERGKPSKLAVVEAEIQEWADSSGLKISKAEKESRALASEKYQQYLKEWDSAHGETLKARVAYDTWQNLFEARRTLESTERAKMRML